MPDARVTFGTRWRALRKRPILILFLKRCWIAYLSLVAYGLFVTYVYPHAARPLFGALAKNRGEWWVRALTAGNAPPAWKSFVNSTAPLVWLVGISLFAALVEWRLSRTLDEAEERARGLAREAENPGHPAERAQLYRAAAEWSFDDGEEATYLEHARSADETAGP